MKKNLFKYICVVLGSAVIATSCTKDLDRTPTNDITADVVYKTPAGYKQVLAKVYGSFALTGNSGPAGSPDVQGLDEGSNADFLRTFFNAQEVTTDEAICGWNDPGIPDLHYQSWTSTNPFLLGLYDRAIFQITMCNEFIRESADDKVAGRGISGTDAEDIKHYRAEARFLRAFQYWVLMDLYANPPFVTENDPIGKYLPPQIKRADLFTYVESELKAIEPLMVTAHQNEYARADQAAVWSLLARLYLNAEVYTGTGRYTDAVTYASKVIGGGYDLKAKYNELFLADNDKNNKEVILPIAYDGLHTQSYGGTSFIINASVGTGMDQKLFGISSGGWGGLRTTQNLPLLFGNYATTKDSRSMFMGNKIEIDNVSAFTDGLAVAKFRNVNADGTPGSNVSQSFSDVDFPLFRLAEQYLIYAEAVLRGGTGGDKATAIGYINKLRQRAYGDATGNVADISLDFILDERARELYWEGFRRTDLVRYNRFTSASYVWPWKGGVKNGTGTDAHFNIFPIPVTDLTANPNLKQNDKY